MFNSVGVHPQLSHNVGASSGCWWVLVSSDPSPYPCTKKEAPGPIEMTEGGSDELFIWQYTTWMRATFIQWWETCMTCLSMKEGRKVVCLFCFVLFCRYEIHQTRMLQIVFLVSLESSLTMEGAFGLVPWCLALWRKSSWLSMCGVEVKKHNIRVVPSLVVLYYGLHDRWKTMQVTKHNRLYRNIELMMGYDGTQKSVIYDV